MVNQKTLHIIRHGKSTWEMPEIEDFDRPLTSRGINNNYLMASRFAANFVTVDSILTSPATRALTTSVCFARSLGISLHKIVIEPHLYFSGIDVIFELILNTSNEINSLIIVGHNPDLTELANALVPSLTDEIPTSSVVTIRFNVENWQQISQPKVSEWFFDYPKKS